MIAGPFGESYAEASGKLRQSAEHSGLWPTIGDWISAKPKSGGGMVIHELFPRRTQIARKIPGKQNKPQVLAANVDTIFLVVGLDGDFNLRRLERFLVQFWDSGAKPVLLLNKADVRNDAKEIAESVRVGLLGVDVISISARTGVGLKELEGYLAEGKTVVLLGSSGVGKSTLLNRLLSSERQRTKMVRESDSRGRHTTTARELFFLASGAMVIDTPGLRELQLWDVRATEVLSIPSFVGNTTPYGWSGYKILRKRSSAIFCGTDSSTASCRSASFLSRGSSDSGNRGCSATSAISSAAFGPNSESTSLDIPVWSASIDTSIVPPMSAAASATCFAVREVVPSFISLVASVAIPAVSFGSFTMPARTINASITLGRLP
jgi:ribosome small subunit-dependent GTPase A